MPSSSKIHVLLSFAILSGASACDDRPSASSASPTSASASAAGAAMGAAPATTATASASATPSASASAAAEPGGGAFTTFSGAPDFQEKTTPQSHLGVGFDVPASWKTEAAVGQNIVSVFSDPPGTVKGRLLVFTGDDASMWATADELAKVEKTRSGTVEVGGKAAGPVPTNTPCEDLVFQVFAVSPKKLKWAGDPRPAVFGDRKRPGSVLEAADPDGKWTIYCLRAAVADDKKLVGAVGWRTDENAAANGRAVANVLRSFRPAGGG